MGLLMGLGLGLGVGAGWVRSHELFAAYVQHRVILSVGARHVDVTVHLTFFEEASEHERAHMDSDRDGRVSGDELRSYAQRLEREAGDAVALRVGGRAVSLIPLVAPEVDLLGHDQVGRGHHRLTLRWFVPTPEDMAAGMQLVVENRLWPGSRALGMIQVEGRDGFGIEAESKSDPVYPPLRPGETRTFGVRVMRVPGPARPGAAGIGS
jgi:hypothetical protein